MSMHADLSFHILRYAVQRVHDGDLAAALDLGFTIDEIRSMELLTLTDLEHLSRLSAHFLRVHVDHDTYRAMIQRVTQEAESKETQDALLLAGAPRSLMAELYGWSALQYAHRRRLLGIASTPGRPPLPTESEEMAVWHHWRSHGEAPMAQRYLQTAKAAGVTVAVTRSIVRAQVWPDANRVRSPRLRTLPASGPRSREA